VPVKPIKRRSKGSGRVNQLPSGRWRARFPGPDGVLRPATRTFQTKLDATAWLQEQGRDVDRGLWQTPVKKAAARDLRSFAEEWLAGRDLKPKSVQQYRRLLDDMILPELGDVPVDKLSVATVRNWHTSMKTTAAAKKTAAEAAAAKKATPGAPVKPVRSGATWVAHAYSLLRAIMNSAYRDDLISANPCRIERAGSSRKVHRTKPASLAELDVIVGAVPPRYRAMILLAGWCALRFGELTELRRKDIDLEAGVVFIQRAVVHVDGKAIVGDPKTEAGIRRVHIPPHVLPAVLAHLELHVGPEMEALLFPARQGGHMVVGSLYRVYYPARAKAGRPDLRFHDLRHTGATLFAATGATLADLMGRLGHTTPGAAMIYQHAAEERDKMLSARLSDLVRPASRPCGDVGTGASGPSTASDHTQLT